jgi:hypothetical protein
MPITAIGISDSSSGAASLSLNIGLDPPTGGDLAIVLVCGKPYNSTVTSVVQATGKAFTLIGAARFTDGTVAAGADSGSMFVEAWYRIQDGTESSDAVVVTEGATAWNAVFALGYMFTKDVGETWETPVIVGGGDATSGTAFSVTGGSDPGIVTGDHTLAFAAFMSDACTPCSVHLTPTATGVTFTNTHDPATDEETTVGGDMGTCVTRSTVSGTSAAAPVLAATLAANGTGSAALIRLRVIAAVQRVTRFTSYPQILAH